MNKKGKTISRKLRNNLVLKLVFSLIIYTVLGIGAFFIAVNLYDTRIWFGQELLYRIAQWFKLRIELFAMAYVMVGYTAIFLYFWNRPFSYLQEVADAAEQMYQSDSALIELSEPLKELQFSMNNTKISLHENERIAKEAEQRKNDLVVYLAHDLKTPLTSVIGYLTLLRDENRISEELRQKYMSISLDKAERLEDLINEFFEITRFNLSNITLEYSRVNLTRMLEQLIFEFKPMLMNKNLNCMLKAASDIMMRCDADKMQRVLDNLLRNAVFYSFENSAVEISAVQNEIEIKLRISNHGNTIPKEKLERIFEQFYRLDTARGSKNGGAGLGLAIAKEIVELHKGRITARSENELIEFEVVLPVL
ncbi:two-component system sensor histidine kinase VanS [Ruminiclostridium sufflavum DSM 19573]|uniref:histidine kinase n=1 Tax=Ruminiclostridium sufflavum DSM 19573 TaxID=1121337 RepID=A0A318XXV9_9FIRM|nr:two-component system sensor histidine kinase VanS [Ruminiclostridium sufflavum DSM 19573]